MRWGWIYMMIFILSGNVLAQTNDNRGYVWLVSGKANLEGNLLIDPASITVIDSSGIRPVFIYDPVNNTIQIDDVDNTYPDSMKICYRHLPFSSSSYATMTLDEYDSTAPFKDYGSNIPSLQDRDQKLFETGQVATSGRLSRGITVGNTRDLMVNSSLNLALDGKLSDDLFIRASITDQDIPYQPEGNTAQLQDFDNVFMQLYNDNFDLAAGDIVMKGPSSRFLKYYKNVQGTQFKSISEKSSMQLGASLAKGKFASVNIEPVDGISGPYRIPGPGGEDFVIVLANSESVFLDGKQMARGFNNDYVIDYNLGEIMFTSRIMITQYSRIRVDYEYADTQYNRSVLTAGYKREVSNGSVYVNAYREMDNKTRPNFDLSEEDIGQLMLAGDDPLNAITSGADSAEFDPDRIMYRKVIIDEEEVFIHSTNPDSAFFEVRFSKTGPNLGDYVQMSGTANGRVFEWVPRVDSIPQGEYVPYQVIVAASKKEMIISGANFKIGDFETLSLETAFSKNDKNLFSTLDSHDDNGGALNFSFNSAGRKINNSDYKIRSGLSLEYLNKYFSPIDRFRPIEFDRDWSYNPDISHEPSDDALFDISFGIEKDRLNGMSYTISRRVKGEQVNGIQQLLNLNKQIGNFQLLSDFFTLRNDQREYKSHWNRMKTDLSYKIGSIRPGYRYSSDHNKILDGDSINASANYFDEHLFYLRSAEQNEKSFFDLGFGIRDDYRPEDGEMIINSQAKTLNFLADRQISESQNIKLAFIYRDVDFLESTKPDHKNNSLSGRLDWTGSFFKEIINNELTYTVANSRELRKEYIFIQVPTGEGFYNWIDSNDDGIKDLNEFFPAVHFDERNFAKIFIPTNDYVDAFENTLNYRFNLKFPMSWKSEGAIKNFLYRLSNTTVWTSTVKTGDKSVEARLLSFLKTLDENEILGMRKNFRTTWFFNRTNPLYGMNFGYRLNHFIDLLTGGIDERKIDAFDLKARMNLGRIYTIRLEGNTQKEYSFSEMLENRDFIIQSRKIQPSISWQPQNKFRFMLSYEYNNRKNIQKIEEAEYSHIHEIGSEIKWNKLKKLNLQGELKYAEVAFRGMENSPVGNSILAGYRPGANMSWLLTLQQTLLDGLQLSVNYQGRKSEGARIIHIGRVMVSALF